jgi:hypothetical protein
LVYDGESWNNDNPPLDSISDVLVSTPVNGNSLVYNTGVWSNQTLSYQFSDLTNVTFSGLSNKDSIAYNGSQWVNVTSGKILQVVSATKTDSFSTTAYAVGLGAEFADITGLALNITPEATDSKVLITVSGMFATSAAENVFFNLVRNNVAIGQSTGADLVNSTATYKGQSQSDMSSFSFTFLDSPATTSTVTYKVEAATESNSVILYINKSGIFSNNNYRGTSSITAMEVRS